MSTTMIHTGPAADLPTTEWGPAKHDPEHPLRRRPVGSPARTALRDADDLRPDDN